MELDSAVPRCFHDPEDPTRRSDAFTTRREGRPTGEASTTLGARRKDFPPSLGAPATGKVEDVEDSMERKESDITHVDTLRCGKAELVQRLLRLEDENNTAKTEHERYVRNAKWTLRSRLEKIWSLWQMNQDLEQDNRVVSDYCSYLYGEMCEWQRLVHFYASILSDVDLFTDAVSELELKHADVVSENGRLKEICVMLQDELAEVRSRCGSDGTRKDLVNLTGGEGPTDDLDASCCRVNFVSDCSSSDGSNTKSPDDPPGRARRLTTVCSIRCPNLLPEPMGCRPSTGPDADGLNNAGQLVFDRRWLPENGEPTEDGSTLTLEDREPEWPSDLKCEVYTFGEGSLMRVVKTSR